MSYDNEDGYDYTWGGLEDMEEITVQINKYWGGGHDLLRDSDGNWHITPANTEERGFMHKRGGKNGGFFSQVMGSRDYWRYEAGRYEHLAEKREGEIEGLWSMIEEAKQEHVSSAERVIELERRLMFYDYLNCRVSLEFLGDNKIKAKIMGGGVSTGMENKVCIIEIPEGVDMMSPVDLVEEDGGRYEVFDGGFKILEGVAEKYRENLRNDTGKRRRRENVTDQDVKAWWILKKDFSYSVIGKIVDRPPGTIQKKLSDLRHGKIEIQGIPKTE